MKGRNILLDATVGVLFSLLVVGAYVTAANYGGLCGVNTPEDWPLCNGNLLPPPDFGSIIEYTHRILASLSGLLLILTALFFWRANDADRSARRLILLALLSILVEIAIGGVVVNTDLAPAVVTLHQAVALLVFGFTLAAATISFRKD
ncbi:MAG TPA: COX15/CtaA family protein [Nitrososphaerales archaeon]|nr:COX15/CtaA family protein [Nitrososphaerales archaeon]